MSQVPGVSEGQNQSVDASRSTSRVVRGIIFAALGGVCWGFSGTCAQLLTSDMGIPVLWITCVRLSLAAVVFFFISFARQRKSMKAVLSDKRSLLGIAGFALLGVLLTQVSYLSAISYTNAGTGTVLERLGLIFIMLYVCLCVRRFPSVRECIGLVLALSGTVIIATQGDLSTLSIPIEGLFWGLISAFALACYTLIPVKALDKWGSLIVTFYAMLIGGVVSSVFMQPWTLGVEVNITIVVVMLGMVFVGTVAAYLFYLQGIADAGPVRAGLVGCIEPVSATIISAVWLGSVVTPSDLVGCAMIVAMVFMVSEGGKAKPKANYAYDGSDHEVPPFRGRASGLGLFGSRVANKQDFRFIIDLLNEGHRALAQRGVKEGIKKYPSSRRVSRSIADHKTYVIESCDFLDQDVEKRPSQKILALFALDPEGDKAYRHATGARWLTEELGGCGEETPPYAALHWVSVASSVRGCGLGKYILETAKHQACEQGCMSIRADVYHENKPMRNLLEKNGYVFCGDIEIRDTFGRVKRRAVYECIL